MPENRLSTIICPRGLLAYMTAQPGHFFSSSLLLPDELLLLKEVSSFFPIYDDICNPKIKKSYPMWQTALPNAATPKSRIVRITFQQTEQLQFARQKHTMHAPRLARGSARARHCLNMMFPQFIIIAPDTFSPSLFSSFPSPRRTLSIDRRSFLVLPPPLAFGYVTQINPH